jgi:hypothetical protein
MNWVYDDGGRKAAGFLGKAGDCVTRSIAIATRLPYSHVYALLNEQARRELPTGGRRSSARNGVFRHTCQQVLEALGWRWVPTMKIGAGCRVHLKAAELPAGRLIVRCSKHTTAVIDGIIHDTYDPSRAGTRCVYGYFTKGTGAGNLA